MSLLTNINLEIPATGTVNWGTAMQSILEALDLGVGSSYGVYLVDTDVNAYDAVHLIGANSGATSLHVVPADLSTLKEAHGVALATGAAGDYVPVLFRGVIGAASGVLPWTGAAMDTELFLHDAGALVETSTLCAFDDGETMFRQRVASCLTEGSYERFLIDPERDPRRGQIAVASARFLQVSGAAATESFANVSGTRWEPSVLVNDNATKVFSYSFVLPPSFRSFDELRTGWAFRVGYLVTGSCSVQATAVHDGAGTKTTIAPTAGTSGSWAFHSVSGTLMQAGAPTAGNPLHVEVTVTGTGTCRLSTVGKLRFFPRTGHGVYS
jgi:hypothetical protein